MIVTRKKRILTKVISRENVLILHEKMPFDNPAAAAVCWPLALHMTLVFVRRLFLLILFDPNYHLKADITVKLIYFVFVPFLRPLIRMNPSLTRRWM